MVVLGRLIHKEQKPHEFINKRVRFRILTFRNGPTQSNRNCEKLIDTENEFGFINSLVSSIVAYQKRPMRQLFIQRTLSHRYYN